MPTLQSTYFRAAATFRSVLGALGAADLARDVPSCPGWTVSDVVSHVLDNHAEALGPERAAAEDLMAAYAAAIPDDPRLAASAPFDTLDLTLHAWDVGRALGRTVQLDDDQLTFLEVFAREAGDRLYVGGEFKRLEEADLEAALAPLVGPLALDRQGRALLPYGRVAV